MFKSSLFMISLISSGLALADMPKVPTGANAQAPAAAQTPTNDVPPHPPHNFPGALGKNVEEKAVVHLNSASVEELAKLPGIGPEKAKAIVAARPFKSIEDLKNVKGLKEATFAKIKGLVNL